MINKTYEWCFLRVYWPIRALVMHTMQHSTFTSLALSSHDYCNKTPLFQKNNQTHSIVTKPKVNIQSKTSPNPLKTPPKNPNPTKARGEANRTAPPAGHVTPQKFAPKSGKREEGPKDKTRVDSIFLFLSPFRP